MSWSFAFKGQKRAVRQAVVDFKNGYDVNSPTPETAMEGRHVEACRTVVLDLIERAAKTDDAMIGVEASGSEWNGGEAKVRVWPETGLLLNQVVDDTPKTAAAPPLTPPAGTGG